MPNNTEKPNILQKVPWEPYKAATGNASPKFSSKSTSNISLLSNQMPDLCKLNQDKDGLVRYNISTNLELFNARRPGYQFDEGDVRFIQQNTAQNPSNNQTNSFVDSRFYTDFQFLKLADDLKNKCFDLNNSNVSKTATQVNKPVNVVGPLATNKLAGEKSHIPKPQVNKYEKRIEYLENQLKGIYEHLQIQTQVNAELKKLLVASMGEDMQYKIERLVSDKERLVYEMENNKQTINRLNEEVEQCSIKCDLWRSKFLACRLMSDEASTWKSFLLLLNKQNEKVLGNLMTDNSLINQKLNEALEMISDIKSGETGFPILKKNHNNLQAANLLLLGLNNKRNKGIPVAFSNQNGSDNRSFFLKTNNEMIGSQMLEQFNWVNMALNEGNNSLSLGNHGKKLGNSEEGNLNVIDSFDKLEQLIERIRISRATIHSRLFQTTGMSGDFDLLVNVCNTCTGKIQTV